MPNTGDKNFRITMGKGFQMKFPNNVVASVQWGQCNYCEQRKLVFTAEEMDIERKAEVWGSNDAEVMAWIERDGKDVGTITKDLFPDQDLRDDVIARLNPAEVLDFLNRCANFQASYFS
jgi:hypothetical protein